MTLGKPIVAVAAVTLTIWGAAAICVAVFVGLVLATAAEASTFEVGDRWDWQLSGPVDLNRDVEMLDLHPDLVSAEQLRVLRAQGIETVCYVSIGTLEQAVPDKADFPAEVIGKIYDDWPDERFLDIRRLDVLIPIMTRRFLACKAMGYSAIEPDNMDVYDQDSGFDLTRKDAILYATTLAHVAHGLSLRIAQKNVPELTDALHRHFDFAITEGCFQYSWCEDIAVYPQTGKPAFNAEYTDVDIEFGEACAEGARLKIAMIRKDRDLHAPVITCQAEY